MIRWKIVVHGGIDGHSRKIMFLRASDNNRAETVGECYDEATLDWGVPSRVRVDYGKENLVVKAKLEAVRGVLDAQGKSRT